MFSIEHFILTGSVLLLLGIMSSKLSSSWGVPVLALFIAVGMLAGSEGVGGIHFNDYSLAHGFGTLALALILFDGGLQTRVSGRQIPWGPSITLATLGVVITAVITGAAATLVLELPWREGMLLGAIIGSTDAAAIFAVLRSSGISVGERVASTLEIESGCNDPMAVFLTVGLIEVLTGTRDPGLGMLWLFLVQMTVGTAVGLGCGYGSAWLLNRIDLPGASLYPVLTTAVGFFSFGLASALGGSGFLAIYLAGLVLGNRPIVLRRGILLFHAGAAWLCQITMFMLLGLLSYPSRLMAVATQGVLITVVLVFVARPFTTWLLLLPFRFTKAEVTFIAWGGLKGAVPIILAIYPLMAGINNAMLLFNVVFFVVLLSVLTQGWTLAALARGLGLQREAEPEPPISLEIEALRHVDGEIVVYTVPKSSRVAGREMRNLALPPGCVVAMLTRGQTVIPPQGSTRIEPGDHVFVVARPSVRAQVDRVFGSEAKPIVAEPEAPEFPLRGNTTVASVQEFYGVLLDSDGTKSLSDVMNERLSGEVAVGRSLSLGEITLTVREVQGTHVERVGLSIRPEEGVAPG